MTQPEHIRALLDKMRCEVIHSDKATMSIPLYEEIKAFIKDSVPAGGEVEL